MTRWGMAVNLTKCAGCQTCTMACKLDNKTPAGVMWRNVRDVEFGKYPNVKRFFLPVQCMQCLHPSCLEVCPTTATKRRPDGIVFIDYEKCIGCGYCVLACPYEARWLIREIESYYDEVDTDTSGTAASFRENHYKDLVGICTKCDFCMDRIDAGLKAGKIVGKDPEATPVCANSCLANAITFGDLEDPSSELSRVIKDRHAFRLHPELGNDPSVYYYW